MDAFKRCETGSSQTVLVGSMICRGGGRHLGWHRENLQQGPGARAPRLSQFVPFLFLGRSSPPSCPLQPLCVSMIPCPALQPGRGWGWPLATGGKRPGAWSPLLQVGDSGFLHNLARTM